MKWFNQSFSRSNIKFHCFYVLLLWVKTNILLTSFFQNLFIKILHTMMHNKIVASFGRFCYLEIESGNRKPHICNICSNKIWLSILSMSSINLSMYVSSSLMFSRKNWIIINKCMVGQNFSRLHAKKLVKWNQSISRISFLKYNGK